MQPVTDPEAIENCLLYHYSTTAVKTVLLHYVLAAFCLRLLVFCTHTLAKKPPVFHTPFCTKISSKEESISK